MVLLGGVWYFLVGFAHASSLGIFGVAFPAPPVSVYYYCNSTITLCSIIQFYPERSYYHSMLATPSLPTYYLLSSGLTLYLLLPPHAVFPILLYIHYSTDILYHVRGMSNERTGFRNHTSLISTPQQ